MIESDMNHHHFNLNHHNHLHHRQQQLFNNCLNENEQEKNDNYNKTDNFANLDTNKLGINEHFFEKFSQKIMNSSNGMREMWNQRNQENLANINAVKAKPILPFKDSFKFHLSNSLLKSIINSKKDKVSEEEEEEEAAANDDYSDKDDENVDQDELSSTVNHENESICKQNSDSSNTEKSKMNHSEKTVEDTESSEKQLANKVSLDENNNITKDISEKITEHDNSNSCSNL
jgi:hypothetical protein